MALERAVRGTGPAKVRPVELYIPSLLSAYAGCYIIPSLRAPLKGCVIHLISALALCLGAPGLPAVARRLSAVASQSVGTEAGGYPDGSRGLPEAAQIPATEPSARGPAEEDLREAKLSSVSRNEQT